MIVKIQMVIFWVWYPVVWKVDTRISEEHTASIFRANNDGMLLRNVGTDYRDTGCHKQKYNTYGWGRVTMQDIQLFAYYNHDTNI